MASTASSMRAVPSVATNQNKRISIYTQNLSGAASKLIHINHHLATTTFDIFMLQETWFLGTTDTNLLTSNGVFEIYRRDRHSFLRPKRSGGGVAIIHRKDLNMQILELPQTTLEIQAIRMSSVIFVNVYLPIYSVVNAISRLIDFVTCIKFIYTQYTACTVYIFGDFNMNGISWIFDEEILGALRADTSRCNRAEKLFAEKITSLGLIQLNHLVNSNGTYLDLILTNELDTFQVEKVPLPDAIDESTIHHDPYTITVNVISSPADDFNESAFSKLLLKKSKSEVSAWAATPHYTINDLSLGRYRNCEVLTQIFRKYTAQKILKTHVAQSKHPWLRNSKYTCQSC